MEKNVHLQVNSFIYLIVEEQRESEKKVEYHSMRWEK